MNRRMVRLSAAALLLGAALTVLAPHMTSYVSSAAVVSAPVVVVRAPFDGILAQSSASSAQPVQAGEDLLRFDALRRDQDVLAAVRAEIDSTRAELSALSTQIEAVVQVQGDLSGSIILDDTAGSQDLAAERRELGPSLENSSIQARALAQEIGLNGQPDSVPGARQRLGELALQKAALAAHQTTLSAHLASLEVQEASLVATRAHRNTFTPASNVAGVVWRAAPAEGARVAAGDTLMEVLDCSNRFVEVYVPGRLFERIRPGDLAAVQLKGAGTWLKAYVEIVRGTGARFDHSGLAPTLTEVRPGDIQVLLRLDAVDPTGLGVAASFCDVGRTAEVRFARMITPSMEQLTATIARLGARAQRLMGRTVDPANSSGTERALLEDAS